MTMLLLYGLYIVLMSFNRRLESRAIAALAGLRLRCGKGSGYDPEGGETEALLGDSGVSNGSAGTSDVGAQSEGEAETDFNVVSGGGSSNEEGG